MYDVLDMTGFTEMVTVEKAYRRMSLDGCQFIAQGANGAVYRYDAETILKIYFAKDALPEIKQERENARRAFVLGINTAIPYGIVRVGDNYGTVTELLNAVSVTELVRNNPGDLSIPVKYYVDLLSSIHAIEAADGELPDMRLIAASWLDTVISQLTEEEAAKLRSLFLSVPQRNTVLHGDYHTSNIMVQNGEPLLIDMDTLCVGHPIFELGSMFNALVGYSELDPSNTESFFGYTYDTALKFWDLILGAYLGTDDIEVKKNVEDKAKIVGYTRMLRRAIRNSADPTSPAKIARCKEVLSDLLQKVDTIVF